MRRAGLRRGGLLLEVLLSLALLVGAATFTLGVVRSALAAIDRSGRETLAADLARAKLAELEAGLVTISELREDGEGIEGVGSVTMFEERDDVAWQVDITTERSEYTGLSLVELTVTEALFGEDPIDDAGVVRCTLRQLMPLRDEAAGEGYETDELLEDLPDDVPGGQPGAREERRP